jgi:hypothetical protein
MSPQDIALYVSSLGFSVLLSVIVVHFFTSKCASTAALAEKLTEGSPGLPQYYLYIIKDPRDSQPLFFPGIRYIE